MAVPANEASGTVVTASKWNALAAQANKAEDATDTTKGVVRLAGDLAGSNSTAAAPRISDSAFILRG